MSGTWTLKAVIENWPLVAPLAIAGYVFTDAKLVTVTVSDGAQVGRGEAGVFYRGESAQSIAAQIETARATIESGITREELCELLPPGGARNAVDCALWDLESRQSGRPVWDLAGVPAPRPLITTFTLGADTPQRMAQAATSHQQAKALKLKLLGDGQDAARVGAVREARPEVWIGVDANQGLDMRRLEELLPPLITARVELIEQPFKVSEDALLETLRSPIALAADESVQSLPDVDSLVGRYQVMNIKLDKCGGLTEALLMLQRARQLGLQVMVGNMGGTSLAMLPAMLVGQFCDVVDLDGPLFLKEDREPAARYEDGHIVPSLKLWGASYGESA
jgi:L-alanine-DL-glutamate epimerase-like enolase superfamily enzyme